MQRLPFGRRALLVLVLVPLATLVAGMATLGARAQRPKAGEAGPGSGCVLDAPRFGGSDDPAEVERQLAFEARSTAVTDPGFYNASVPSTPTIHAASHGFVVVFYRPGLAEGTLRGLAALAAAGQATKAPVIVAPRRQAPALVTLGLRERLTCRAGGLAEVARTRAFAATIYASLKP
jgi:hypothetical protein